MPITCQAYYDLLVKTSESGGFPAINEKRECVYRSKDGKRKCPIGLLISEEDYTPAFEKKTVNVLFMIPNFAWQIRRVCPEGLGKGSLLAIQWHHDRCVMFLDNEWDHIGFIQRLNQEPCFANVTQVLNTTTNPKS